MIDLALRYVIPAAFAVLPEAMRSTNATAQMLAIGLQESKFLERHQLPRSRGGPLGPANGLWQFEELGGINGVIEHPLTRGPLAEALRRLRYGNLIGNRHALHALVADNDIVAAVFARLNLWWLPTRLPGQYEPEMGWRQYLDAWRPGSPHPTTWPAYYAEAWERVNRTRDTLSGGETDT